MDRYLDIEIDIFEQYIKLRSLFVCPIITQEPLDRFASNFDLGTQETHRNVLSLC